MIKAYEIIENVLHAFRGLPVRLEAITEKSAEWFRSHGREPKNRNPLASGNRSPLDHYLKFIRLYEAAQTGAGKMLNNRVHAELQAEFNETDKICQIALHTAVLKESFDVLKALNEADFADRSTSELAAIENEVMELRDAADNVFAHVRKIKIQKKMKDKLR